MCVGGEEVIASEGLCKNWGTKRSVKRKLSWNL